MNAIIFMASLTTYHQKSFEGQALNCMKEDLRVFEIVANYYYFRHIPVFLVFNKEDVLRVSLCRFVGVWLLVGCASVRELRSECRMSPKI